MSELIGHYCMTIEHLEETIARIARERDLLKDEVDRLNKENFEQSMLISQLREGSAGHAPCD